MVANSWYLIVNISPNEADSAVCIAFAATKHKPSLKYPSSLVQQ